MRRRKAFFLILVFVLLAAAGTDAEQLSPDEITVAAVGDIMLGHRAEPYLTREGPDYPFVSVLPVLQQARLVIGNLESPISSRGTAVENKKFTLRAAPMAVAALKAAGIRVVSLANNHTMDFGPLALQDTLKVLGENDILYAGAGMNLDDARAAAFLKVGDQTLAFLSYSLTFPL